MTALAASERPLILEARRGCANFAARARSSGGADDVEAVGERLQRLDDGVDLDLAVHCANKYRGRWKRVSISIEGRPCGQDGLRRQEEPAAPAGGGGLLDLDG